MIRTLPLLLCCCVLVGCTVTRNVGAFFDTPRSVPEPDLLPAKAPPEGLRVWWVGHATTIIQIEDRVLITDPVWTETVGGVSRRLVEPGVSISSLPERVDAALISHMHFDHLSTPSLNLLADRLEKVIVPPSGARYIPSALDDEVLEISRWESWERGGLRVTAVPVKHSGWRWLMDAPWMREAYTGYVIEYKGRTVYFGGDTAWAPELFKETRSRFGPIDVAILPIAPSKPRDLYAHVHVGPEEAVRAGKMLGARHIIPIHHSTFHQGEAPLGEPLKDALAAAKREGVALRALGIGEMWSAPSKGEGGAWNR